MDRELQMVLSVHLYLIHLGRLVGLSRLEEVEEVELATQLWVNPSFTSCEVSSK